MLVGDCFLEPPVRSSVYGQFVSTAVPLDIKRRFENLLESATYVVAADADYNSFSTRSKTFLSSYRKNIYEIRSYHKVDTKTYFQLHEKQKLISIILEALSKNHKVAVPSNSKKFIVTLETIVHEKYPNKRCKAFYNSDDGKHTYDETVKKDELAQLDILMYSPSVGPGVSFDFTMDIVVSYFLNSEASAKMRFYLQMLQRVRNVSTSKVFFMLDGKKVFKISAVKAYFGGEKLSVDRLKRVKGY